MSKLEPTRTCSNPTATEVLRRALDECGVEWEDMSIRPYACTSWRDPDGEPCTALEGADDIPDGKLSVQALLTPEQAIAATLGVRTCHDEGTFKSWGLFTCSNCSIVFPLGAVKDAPSIGRTLPPKYCPNCGAKIVEPTTNDVDAEVAQ